WPERTPKDEEERKVFIAEHHKQKTELFMLIDQALTNGVKVAVCSTSNEKASHACLDQNEQGRSRYSQEM
ncbi:unnamed protein product, partial [Arabis nemorensis]